MGIFAKKSLGQNFLRSQKALSQIIEAADIATDISDHIQSDITGDTAEADIVLEIGPGEGALTAKLLETPAKVIAVEKDDRLIPLLNQKFQTALETGKLRIIHGDILEISFSELGLAHHRFKVIANIPYYITGLLIPLILSGPLQPSKAVLLVQKEVAERIVARNGKHSILSLSVQAYGSARIIDKVPRGAFVPAPNVDSAIIEISDISKDFFKEISETAFFTTVKKGFAHKRKLLKSNLGLSDEILQNIGLSPQARAEDLHLQDWKKIARLV